MENEASLKLPNANAVRPVFGAEPGQTWEQYQKELARYESGHEARLLAAARLTALEEFYRLLNRLLRREPAPTDLPAATRPAKPVFGATLGETWGQYQEELAKYETAREGWLLAETRRTIYTLRPNATSAPVTNSKPVKPVFGATKGQTWGQYQDELMQFEAEHEAWFLAEACRTVDQEFKAIQLQARTLGWIEAARLGSAAISAKTAHTQADVKFQRGLSQVAGMSDLKDQLMQEVVGPFKDPTLYSQYRVSLPNGILFYGPPGYGKTNIARNLAEELGWHFQYCRPSDVASPYIHDTVSRIRAVFSTAIEKAPSVVFIDEFEAFVPARSGLGGHQQYKAEEVNEFLANLEGCAEHKVLVIAATNEPERIDPAVRRSGRFDKLIFIPPPDAEARRAMIEFHLRDRPVEAPIDTVGIAAVLNGYSASDIKLLADEAARMALKRRELITTAT